MAQLPYSINFSKGKSTNTIEINGSLVIIHIEKIYNELNKHIDFSNNLTLEIKEVESIDITFVQLLLALKKEFAKASRNIIINLDLSAESWTLLQNSGFHKNLIN